MNPETKRICADYDQMCTTLFWKRYIEKILEKRKVATISLITASLSEVPELQGKIKALDIILRIPSDLTGKED